MDSTRMQEAYERIRSWLLRGEFAPGDRLVNRALGTALGVSTVTVREALHRLSSEGLVDYVPNAGAFVRAPSRTELRQLYELRRALDEFAVHRLAGTLEVATCHGLRRLSAQGLDQCRASHRAGRTWLADDALHVFIDATVRFQRTLVAATGNGWLVQAREPLELVDRMVRARIRRMPLARALGICRLQRRMLVALRTGNVPAAIACLRARDARDLRDAVRTVRDAVSAAATLHQMPERGRTAPRPPGPKLSVDPPANGGFEAFDAWGQ